MQNIRDIGIIKRWIGDHGYVINVITGEEAKIRINNLEIAPTHLDKGVIVSYQTINPSKQGERKKVTQVRLLESDIKNGVVDAKLIGECLIRLNSKSMLKRHGIEYVNNMKKYLITAWISTNNKDETFNLERIKQLLSYIKDSNSRIIFTRLLPKNILLRGEAKELRELLSKDEKINILTKICESNIIEASEIDDEIKELIPILKYYEAVELQKIVDMNAKYKGFLWKSATEEAKKKIIYNYHSKFFTKFDTISREVFKLLNERSNLIKFDCNSIYPELNEQDQALVEIWASGKNSNNKDFILATMLSARAAEKTAIKFFQSFNYSSIEDVSIYQLTNSDSRWKLCDLLIDATLYVDVKNARRANNNSGALSEICVPEFKKIRDSNADVEILGVLSPYLTLKNIIECNYSYQEITILGRINKPEIDCLENRYKHNFLSISMPRAGDGNAQFLPAWLFDYSDRFYNPLLNLLKNVSLSFLEIPNYEEVKMLGYNPLSFFLLLSLDLPEEWEQVLPSWKLKFYNSLINIIRNVTPKRFTLPDLFLFLLSHFLDMLHSSCTEKYHPRDYIDILYFKNTEMRYPIGILDPLGTITNLIDTLSSLWEEGEVIKIREFKYYSFNYRGILKGKRNRNDERMTTIMAYCGGSIIGKDKKYKGKCLCSPLILGKNKECPICGHLICGICDYCNNKCPRYKNNHLLGKTLRDQVEETRIPESYPF